MERSTLPKSIRARSGNDEYLNNFEINDSTLVVYDEEEKEQIKFGIFSAMDTDQEPEDTPLPTPTVRIEDQAIKEERGLRVSSSQEDSDEFKYDCTSFNNLFFYKAAQQLMLLNSVELEALESELGFGRTGSEMEADLRVIVNSQDKLDEAIAPLQYTAYLDNLALSCSRHIARGAY